MTANRSQAWSSSPWWRALSRSPLSPVLLLGMVLALDGLAARSELTLLWEGLLDELAHLTTAALALTAIAATQRQPLAGSLIVPALLSAVLIDVDHVPAVLGVEQLDAGGRPFSHSLATVAVLLAVAGLWRRRAMWCLGAALGVCLHFVRDIATGPGLPLWWPVASVDVLLPHELYLATMVSCALLGTARHRGPRRRRTDRNDVISSRTDAWSGPC